MIEMKNLEDLDACLEISGGGLVLIFKHSTRCPISAAAYKRFLAFVERAGEDFPPWYLVKVVETRLVSDEITRRLGVTHQSPQLILVKNAAALWHASHGQITADKLSAALSQPT